MAFISEFIKPSVLLEACCLLSMEKSNKGERFHPQAQDYPRKQGWSTWTWKNERAVFSQSPLVGTEHVGVKTSGLNSWLWLLAGYDGPSTESQEEPAKMQVQIQSHIFFFLLLLICPSKKQDKDKQTKTTKKTIQPTKIKSPQTQNHNQKNLPPTTKRQNNQIPKQTKKKRSKALFMAMKEGMLMSTTKYNFSFFTEW